MSARAQDVQVPRCQECDRRLLAGESRVIVGGKPVCAECEYRAQMVAQQRREPNRIRL